MQNYVRFSFSKVTYAWALNQTLSSFALPVDGLALSQRIWNVTFTEAVIEKFYVNENGDRLADFTLKDFNPDSTEMNVSKRETRARRTTARLELLSADRAVVELVWLSLSLSLSLFLILTSNLFR